MTDVSGQWADTNITRRMEHLRDCDTYQQRCRFLYSPLQWLSRSTDLPWANLVALIYAVMT
jgi:hypothetical protein